MLRPYAELSCDDACKRIRADLRHELELLEKDLAAAGDARNQARKALNQADEKGDAGGAKAAAEVLAGAEEKYSKLKQDVQDLKAQLAKRYMNPEVSAEEARERLSECDKRHHEALAALKEAEANLAAALAEMRDAEDLVNWCNHYEAQ